MKSQHHKKIIPEPCQNFCICEYCVSEVLIGGRQGLWREWKCFFARLFVLFNGFMFCEQIARIKILHIHKVMKRVISELIIRVSLLQSICLSDI